MTHAKNQAQEPNTTKSLAAGISLLLLAGVSFFLTVQDISFRDSHQIMRQSAEKVEGRLHEYETQVDRFLQDTSLLLKLASGKSQEKDIQQVSTKPYTILLYNQKDQLIFWNDNKVNLYYPASYFRQASNLIKLKSGYFELIRKRIYIANRGLVQAFALIPIYYDYEVTNEYLRNGFALNTSIPSYISLNTRIDQGPVQVSTKDDTPLFSLSLNKNQLDDQSNRTRLILEFLMLLFFFGGLHFITIPFTRQPNAASQFLSFTILAGIVCCVRYLMLQYQIPAEWAKLELFHPQVYATSPLNRSLGDLFMNAMLVLWLAGFFVSYIQLPSTGQKIPSYVAQVKSALILLALLALPTGLYEIVRHLIMDSTISFNLNNIFSLSLYSVIGLIVIILTFFTYFLIAMKLLRHVISEDLIRQQRVTLVLGMGAVAYLLSSLFIAWHIALLVILWAILFVTVLYYFLSRHQAIVSFTGVIAFTVFFSVFAAAILFRYNHIKELSDRKLFAENLANERDHVTEYLYEDIEKRIMNDKFLKQYYTTPYISTSAIFERIRSLYFSGYFSKYEIDIYTVDQEGNAYKGGGRLPLDYYMSEDLYENAEQTSAKYLFFIPKPSGQYIYHASIPIMVNNKFKGTLLVMMEPKVYIRSNVYPELLLSKNVKTTARDENYRFSVYVDNKLVNSRNCYPRYYLRNENLDTIEENFYKCYKDGYSHLIHTPTSNKEVIVSSQDRQFFNALSLFSYLFFFFIVFVLVQFSWSGLIRWIRGQTSPSELLQFTLQKKIQYAMLLIIILPFFIMGWVTIRQLQEEYDEYHRERLVRKENTILADIEQTVKKAVEQLPGQPRGWNDFVQNRMDQRINAIANIHSMDINLYGLNGNLLLSSQPDIFQKGLQSRRMDPGAYHQLASFGAGRVLQEEAIGNLQYLSIYVPVKNPMGETLAYLNLPYFAKEKNLKNEINSFLVALINVYVFLLLCGGGLAFFLSQSITRPLAEIRQKLRGVELGKQNKPINWQSSDEIGKMINEYNKMIEELEHKADLLAKTERESAWREMAQQVAHEIKNPLTPMKLSIQHLQRALKEGRPDADEQVEKVGNRLIEQIEHLSQIASEFSNFAKMPQAEMEDVDLNKIVRSSVQLYEDNGKATVMYNDPEEPCKIVGDENQLSRAFTNLINNAVEAVPDNREGHVDVQLQEEEQQYQVTITDNGEGIPEEQRDKIFVPNFTTKGSGTGLGLAITKQIIENMGGTITFTSLENKGTTFTIRFRKKDAPHQTS